MGKRTAHIISILLHPMWVPLLSTVAVFYYCPFLVLPYAPSKYYLFLLIGLFTAVGPMGSAFILHRSGYISSIRMPERSDRPVPLAIATAYHCVLTYFLITEMGGSMLVSALILSISLALTILTFISTYWKISIHAAAFSGAVGFFLSLRIAFPEYPLVYPLTIAILCCGAVISARLSLGAHTAQETTSGFIVGFFTCFIVNMSYVWLAY